MQQPSQLPLFSSSAFHKPYNYPFPSTRYQGSKRNLIDWIWENVCDLTFDSVLDVFGGTGVVSHLFKNAGKQVIYNDVLHFNHQIGLALIENRHMTLSEDDIEDILSIEGGDYPNFIARTFHDIYFTDAENEWLDRVVTNIRTRIDNPYRQAIAFFALFQACLIKRPYNLFHRANLYMRMARVERSFGNKTTWDTPFDIHFRQFVQEANAAVFDNGQPNRAIQCDGLETVQGQDLVYIDPPYLNRKGVGVDYFGFYHFLEGLVDYDHWHANVDYSSKHRRLLPQKSIWNSPHTIADAFDSLFARHQGSILVVSYRDDGIPTKSELVALLRRYKPVVHEAALPKQYVLSSQKSHELLLIAP